MMKKAIVFFAVLSLCLLVTLPSLALEVDDVIGVWLFDDGKGDTAKDSSGNGNDGKLIAKPTWVKNGKFGGENENKQRSIRRHIQDGSEAMTELRKEYRRSLVRFVG